MLLADGFEDAFMDTVLDHAGTCRAHKGSVVMYVDCNEAKWREVLK